MSVKSIFIVLITISQFLCQAKAQDNKINEFEGIIIYYETDSIPEEVFLLPCKVVYKNCFTDFIDSTLKNYKGKLMDIYFKGMRWGMPDLLSVVQQMNYVQCNRMSADGQFFKQMRISAGKIFTDATHLVKLYEYSEDNTDFVLEFNSAKYNFVSYDFDYEKKGTPVSFKPIFLK